MRLRPTIRDLSTSHDPTVMLFVSVSLYLAALSPNFSIIPFHFFVLNIIRIPIAKSQFVYCWYLHWFVILYPKLSCKSPFLRHLFSKSTEQICRPLVSEHYDYLPYHTLINKADSPYWTRRRSENWEYIQSDVRNDVRSVSYLYG